MGTWKWGRFKRDRHRDGRHIRDPEGGHERATKSVEGKIYEMVRRVSGPATATGAAGEEKYTSRGRRAGWKAIGTEGAAAQAVSEAREGTVSEWLRLGGRYVTE